MLLDIRFVARHTGYFAGDGEGIVTAGGQPGTASIHVFDAVTLQPVAQTRSLPNGHYLVPYLDPSRAYLVLARHPQRHYDPVSYDDVKPASNRTISEQTALWQSWL